ncbi:MAG: alpha/beta hydrolase [Pseudomonadota bacterium]
MIGLPRGETARITAEDGTPITLWVAPPVGDRAVILTFMGNSGHIRAAANRVRLLADAGYGIILMNYRGAGQMPGAPSQSAIMQDSTLVYDSLDEILGETIPQSRRVIYGYSLGAAVAAQLAAQRPAAAVVLAASFNRLCETAEFHYPIFPVCMILPDNRWASADRIGEIEAPLLMLHGEVDEVIPVDQGLRLYDQAREPKDLVLYPNGNHADLHLHGAREDIRDWLDRTLAAGGAG